MAIDRRVFMAGLGASALPDRALAFAVPAEPRLIAADYAARRESFRSHLTRMGPAPDQGDPLRPAPEGAQTVTYFSGPLPLSAWVSAPARSSAPAPAVLFLHGGNALTVDHWILTLPFRRAGYVAMAPALRGENGQPGSFSAFYDETADVLAAAQTLRNLPGVDRDRIYLAGHSIGGTQALLAAMSSRIFRGATSFSGNPNAFAFFKRFPEEICFDTTDPAEFEMRSAACYATSFKCPTRIFHGTAETRLEAASALTARRAKAAGLDVEAQTLPGDHFTALRGELPASIAFFAKL